MGVKPHDVDPTHALVMAGASLPGMAVDTFVASGAGGGDMIRVVLFETVAVGLPAGRVALVMQRSAARALADLLAATDSKIAAHLAAQGQ